jgi:heme A synthase
MQVQRAGASPLYDKDYLIMFNKWIRIIHRWLAIPIMAALVISIIWAITQGPTTPAPNWVAALGIGSLLSLFITGSYMFFQHYWAKWRRGRRSGVAAAAVRGSGD